MHSLSSDTKKYRFDVALVGAILLLCALWVWRRDVMSHRAQIDESGTATTLDLNKMNTARIFDVNTGKQVTLPSGDRAPKRLLVFLSAADCSSCLVSLADWTSLSKSYPDDKFQVDLLYIYTSPDELSQFREAYNPPYHIYLDTAGDVAKRLAIPPETPVTVLVDKDFRVLAAQGPHQDDGSRQAFREQVKRLVSD